MGATTATLPKPSSYQTYFEISALEAGFIQLPLAWYVHGAQPTERRIVPSLAFCLRHSISKAYILFDLGIRKDIQSYSPAIRSLIAKAMPVTVPHSVDESLRKGGIQPKDIRTIILSHLHFDQCVCASVQP